MKKKVLKGSLIAIVLLIATICGLFVYSEKVRKIELIENAKNAVGELVADLRTDTSEVTIVDVTGLIRGEEIEHEHAYITKFDANNHWNECKICYEKFNIEEHTLVDNGWIMGSANNCNENNVHKFSCTCGYNNSNNNGRKSHTWTSEWNPDGCYKRDYCTSCRESKFDHYCILSDGSTITCTNLGTCKICNHTWNSSNVWHACYGIIEKGYCNKCHQEIVTIVDKEVVSIDKINSIINFKISVLLPQGSIPENIGPLVEGTIGRGASATKSTSSRDENGGTIITYNVSANYGGKQYLRRI